jgi:hypothetical protein
MAFYDSAGHIRWCGRMTWLVRVKWCPRELRCSVVIVEGMVAYLYEVQSWAGDDKVVVDKVAIPLFEVCYYHEERVKKK